MRPLSRVVTGPEAAALDAATIAAGVPSRALMQRAGAQAAAEIASRYPDLLRRGVLVLAGPGNNGGDGWVIARALATAGAEVNVIAPEPARSDDGMAERELALSFVSEVEDYSGEGVVVDALLGTGAAGPMREAMASASQVMILARDRGAAIVAVDLPSGLDATNGGGSSVIPADLTVTFGNFKRGHLISRGMCGTIVAVDIGLLPDDADGLSIIDALSFGVLSHDPVGIPVVDAAWVRDMLPRLAADAHKGTRKKLVLYGGAPGMAGAVILGLRAALASGIGMVKARVHAQTADAVHGAVPAALIDAWSGDATPDAWADVLVMGPGLGRDGARTAVERAIARHNGPVLLDADALTAFAGDLRGLRAAIDGRTCLITPHVVECARLAGLDAAAVLARRFDVGAELAEATGATVLLKGVPTIISSPGGDRLVVAEGTPALATGGSGDLLSGIAGTLLAQMDDPLTAAACAAFVHGRAARLAGAFIRGTTLEQVLEMLPNAWRIPDEPLRYPVLAELPALPTQ